MKEALLYRKLKNNKVRCYLCSHQCLINLGKRGICGVRENRRGKLYTLVYGKVIAFGVDPIEKKPLFHFLPGSLAYSLATVGCNFRCQNCQNWQISQAPRLSKRIQGFKFSPSEIVEETLKNRCQSIAYTYTEPTIFLEYALDIMKIAKKKGLKNVWVSNGFMSSKALELISPYLDAINIDLKSFKDKTYQKYFGGRLEPVLKNLKEIKEKGIWLEVTTLIIPGVNDQEEEIRQIALFIKKELGRETPWHISKFSPEISWQMQSYSPTPKETIQKAREIGLEIGLKYVYSGNLWDDLGENTYCPKCGELNIERKGYIIRRFDKQGKCWKCGEDLDLILE